MSDHETVDHPQHYGGDDVYEHQKVVRAWGLGYHLGNATKYICRAGKKTIGVKGQIEDLEKALWYLNAEIAFRAMGGTTSAHFVYALIDPAEPNHVRYVGKTSNLKVRPLWHTKYFNADWVKPTHKSKWLGSLRDAGREADWYVLAVASDENELNELEKRFIKELKQQGHRLTNGTEGGEGALGRKPSVETRFKIGSANRGKKLSLETRLKMSAARIGRKRQPHSQEAKAKIAASKRGKPLSAAHRAKLVVAQRERRKRG